MGRKIRARAADIITCVRIACSVPLLIVPVFSPAFYALYLLGGLSDMIDGPVARLTGTVSVSGSKLDSAADLCFAAACLYKILPAVALPVYVRIWICAIALVRIANICAGFIVRHRFAAEHTVLNKITGALLFALPLTMSFIDIRLSAAAVCAIASCAALQESRLVLAHAHPSSSTLENPR